MTYSLPALMLTDDGKGGRVAEFMQLLIEDTKDQAKIAVARRHAAERAVAQDSAAIDSGDAPETADAAGVPVTKADDGKVTKCFSPRIRTTTVGAGQIE